MVDEIKNDEKEGADKALIDEIADLDFTGDDKPLDVSTEEDSKTVDEGEKKDETVDDDKESVDESKEGLDDEKEKKKDTETPEEEEDKKVSAEDKGEKPDESKEEGDIKGEVSQVDKLLAEIDRLSGPIIPDAEQESKPKPEGEADEEKDKKKDAEGLVHDFVKNIDMDDVASDSAVFNKILHAVIARVEQRTTEQVLRTIPQIVGSQVQQQTYFKKMADTFYNDNKDLINVKQVVKACAQQLQKNNPEWEIEKVFAEAAVKTRETLGMSAKKVESDESITSAEDAAFAKSKGGSKSNLKQQKSSLQAEIDEL